MRILIKDNALTYARIKSGYSQRQLSAAIGASSSYISQIEKGDKSPSPQQAVKICQVLCCKFDDLFEIQNHCGCGNN